MTSPKIPVPNPAAGPLVPCPSCGQTTVFAPSNAYRPFCSAHCKNVDFGAWASEHFRVEAREAPDDEDPGGAEPQPGTSAGGNWRH